MRGDTLLKCQINRALTYRISRAVRTGMMGHIVQAIADQLVLTIISKQPEAGHITESNGTSKVNVADSFTGCVKDQLQHLPAIDYFLLRQFILRYVVNNCDYSFTGFHIIQSLDSYSRPEGSAVFAPELDLFPAVNIM